MNLRKIMVILLLTTIFIVLGFPFGWYDEVTPSGGIGADHHIFMTFFFQPFADLGHYGYPAAWSNALPTVFFLNLIIAVLVYFLLKNMGWMT